MIRSHILAKLFQLNAPRREPNRDFLTSSMICLSTFFFPANHFQSIWAGNRKIQFKPLLSFLMLFDILSQPAQETLCNFKESLEEIEWDKKERQVENYFSTKLDWFWKKFKSDGHASFSTLVIINYLPYWELRLNNMWYATNVTSKLWIISPHIILQ